MKTIPMLLLCASLSAAQQVYTIPYGSKGNSIELAIANTSTLPVEQLKVVVTEAPKDLEFTSKMVTLPSVKAQEEQTVSFTFGTGRNAEVKKEQKVTFTISSKSGQQWTKEIKYSIAPPEVYELYQNYPNPFNPVTVIGYQLPMDSRMNLKVYDMVGREVMTIADEQQSAGGHEMTFDASRFASGIYIYRLVAVDEKNQRHTYQKKMVLLK